MLLSMSQLIFRNFMLTSCFLRLIDRWLREDEVAAETKVRLTTHRVSQSSLESSDAVPLMLINSTSPFYFPMLYIN
jgi:hypothetical protein